MSDHIPAIETRYAGCHFRSRLEARWAVFFDHCKIEWQYEAEGFRGVRDVPYLPDFYLPKIHPPYSDDRWPPKGVHVEVKGTDEALRADSSKIGACIDYNATALAQGLLILGPIPHIPTRFGSIVTHDAAYWHEGVTTCPFIFMDNRQGAMRVDYRSPIVPLSDMNTGSATEELPEAATVKARVWHITFNEGDGDRAYSMPQIVFDAYVAARSARFEHGQSGAA